MTEIQKTKRVLGIFHFNGIFKCLFKITVTYRRTMSVLVIEYWNLRFIWNLVLEIWDFQYSVNSLQIF